MWLRGAAGEPGYLTGKDAEAAGCDAVAEPVVTGHADMRVVDKIIGLALAAAGITLDGADPDPTDDGEDGDPDGTGADDGDHDGAENSGDGQQAWGIAGAGRGTPTARAASRARSRARERFTPDAMQALRYAIARLAIDFVSGPAGLAGWLRTTLLAPPVQHPVAAAGHRLLRLHPGQHPPRRPAPRPRLRLATVRTTRRLVRRAPPAAQGRRRQNRRE